MAGSRKQSIRSPETFQRLRLSHVSLNNEVILKPLPAPPCDVCAMGFIPGYIRNETSAVRKRMFRSSTDWCSLHREARLHGHMCIIARQRDDFNMGWNCPTCGTDIHPGYWKRISLNGEGGALAIVMGAPLIGSREPHWVQHPCLSEMLHPMGFPKLDPAARPVSDGT